jgi:protein involved in polysaccharide export with SLBB domain
MTNRYTPWIIFILILFAGISAFAQVPTGDAGNVQADLTADAVDASRNIMLARSSADYRVTPGDVYTLSFAAGGTPVTYIISVDTSYRIRVANLGVVSGAGKTFMQLKNEVEAIVARNFPLSGVQLVLTQPAVFMVFVNGEVHRAGEVSAWGLSRLSALTGDNLTNFASIRDISIRSSNGQVQVYDLFRAQRFGDMSQNPYLRPGDIVTFNRINRSITVSGAVERPGTYQILRGEKLKDLINLYGNGFLPLADKTRVRLTRFIGSSEISGDITYLSREQLESDFDLQHMDIINIPDITATRPAVHANRVERRITLEGEVRRPGTFELLPHENLRDLIESYGDGFSPLADPSRMELVRVINSNSVTGDRIFLSEMDFEENFILEHFDTITVPSILQLRSVIFVEGAVGRLDTTTGLSTSNRLVVRFVEGETYASLARRNIEWFSEVSNVEGAYVIRNNQRIHLNLHFALYDASFRGIVPIHENDILIIPFRQSFITVAGAVRVPGRYPFIPDRSWEYYIGLAGGFIPGQNAQNSLTIVNYEGKRLSKSDIITPETTITANTNHFLFFFNQYGPVTTMVLSAVSTILSIMLLTR